MSDKYIVEAKRLAARQQLTQHDWLVSFEWFESIDSTNDRVKRWASTLTRQDLPCLVIADQQTAGRGRGTNAWWSPQGCLMFSLLWAFPNQEWEHKIEARHSISQLSLVVGLAMAQAIERWSQVRCQLKWPNDIFILGKKAAGILIESMQIAEAPGDQSPVGFSKRAWVVGVGVNVHVPLHEAPLEVNQRATSLHQHTNMPPTVEDVLLEFLDVFPKFVEAWVQDEDFVVKNWQTRCFLTDRIVEVESFQNILRGRCLGVNRSAELGIADERGKRHWIRAGVIRSWS